MAGEADPSDVVFLLGAGASKAIAKVPDTYEFVDVFRASLGADHPDRAVLDGVLARLAAWNGKPVDIELLLDALTRVEERAKDPGLVFCRDAAPLDDGLVASAGRLCAALRDCIKQNTYVGPERTAQLSPLMDFVRHHGCIDVATLNYDTVIEEFGQRERIEVHDGFLLDWSPKSLRNAKSGIRLYKLHGSVTWYETDDGRYVKAPTKVSSSKVELVQAGHAGSLMLYPVRKWAYSEPMVGLLFQFKRLLEDARTRFLVVVGYSFRDDHVQGVIRDATRNNPSLEIVVVDPAAYAIRSKLFESRSGPQWPAYVRPRVLCLPYRFEAVLPHLKTLYLDGLRTAADAERAAVFSDSKGGKAAEWDTAANHFAECEHDERRRGAEARRAAPEADPLKALSATVIFAANSIVGGNESLAMSALHDAVAACRDHIADRVYCESEIGGRRIEARLSLGGTSSWAPIDLLRRVTTIHRRCQRSFNCALRRTDAMSRLDAAIDGIRSILQLLGDTTTDEQGWLRSPACPAATRETLRDAVDKFRATPRTESDPARRKALNEVLTTSVRASMNAVLDNAVASVPGVAQRTGRSASA